MSNRKCRCRVCQYADMVDNHLSEITEYEDAHDFFEKMYLRLCSAEMDNDVNKAMRNGDWPSGKLVYVPKCAEGELK